MFFDRENYDFEPLEKNQLDAMLAAWEEDLKIKSGELSGMASPSQREVA